MGLRKIYSALIVLTLASVYGKEVYEGNGTSRQTYPKFYLGSKIMKCQIDSPELFYYKVALPSINSLFDEGKIFFAVLMDRLESSLAGTEKYEYLAKEWAFLTNVIIESFELAINRIDIVWDAIIDQNDTILLPWEIQMCKVFLMELFNNLMDEYQVVEAVVKTGTKEIINTLQKYIIEVMEILEDKVYYENSPEGEPKTETQLLDRMEKALSHLEPNFVGALLKKLLYMAKTKRLHSWQSSTANFLAEPMEEISFTIQTFKVSSEENPFFWNEMTEILKSVNGSILLDKQEILELYLSNEELLIDSVIKLLTMDTSQ